MTDLAARKSAARRAASARRDRLRDPAAELAANAALADILQAHAGQVIAAYLPIRSEISPLPALQTMQHSATLVMPVVAGPGQPLVFRAWQPGAMLQAGGLGLREPATGAILQPQVVIVPLLAFDGSGHRLGYGGGYYDRTLQALRAAGAVVAIGLAYAGQRVGDIPHEATDQPLDLIVTEDGIFQPAPE